MNKVTEYEKAWLAGIWDGEGTVSMSKSVRKGLTRKEQYQLAVTISIGNTNKAMMDKVAEILTKAGMAFFVWKYKDKKLPNAKMVTKLKVNQGLHYQHTMDFIDMLLPYAVAKKEQMWLARRFCVLRILARRKPYGVAEKRVYVAVRKLNSWGKVGRYGAQIE